jgi:hypothetical protein
MRSAGAIGLLVLVPLLACPVTSSAAPRSVGERCRIAKLDAIGTATAGELRCWSQGLRRGRSDADPACLAAADAKLVRAFARADGDGACPPAAADAAQAITSFVAAQAASTSPPVATATPAPTATPSGSGGCGNGIVEEGEHCDGGPYCDPSCSFAFPSLCCGIGTQACVALDDITDADQCFLAGGTPHVGASCVSPDPTCVQGQPCAGTCQPATFAATTFCCDGGTSCTERTLSDTESLGSYLLQCGSAGLVEGSCVAGDCLPGS